MVGVVSSEIFIQLGFVIIVAAVAALILRLIRQPQILAYVLVGILITPVFKLVTDTSLIGSMSIIGIAFLLFIVGLEMDIKGLRNVALVTTVGGSIQIALLFVFGYLVALLLGFLSIEAAYLGLMIAFSSTMIVMKLLSDKRELNTLHGRITIGILLMEDIIAIFALSILTSINGFSLPVFGIAFAKFIAIFPLAFLASKYLFPRIFRFAAKYQELLLITSLAVCFIFSLVFYYLGFSIAIGAFIAGVALGNLEYNLEIIGKVKSLKDFFSLLFFVSLGMGISISAIQGLWIPLVVIVATIVLVKPTVIMTICSLFKYTKKPAFLTATSLAQVGEFSLIIITQGLLLGHVSQELFSLTIIITLITITISSYYIQHNESFYGSLKKPLKIFDKFTTKGLEYLPEDRTQPTIVLCGYNRIGYSIVKGLKNFKRRLLVIDFNPEIIDHLIKKEIHCIYGDVTDEEIREKMNLANIKMLISTVPSIEDSLLLIKSAREVNKKAKIIVTSSEIDSCLRLYDAGADYVIMPHFLGGIHISNVLTKMRKRKKVLRIEREKHIDELEERKQLGHEHPKHH